MTSRKFHKCAIVFKMATNKLGLVSLKVLKNYRNRISYSLIHKYAFCTAKVDDEGLSNVKKYGFAEFSEKQEEFIKLKPQPKPEAETFVSLLRNSKFIDMGDPVGKVVIGKIFHVVGDNLYIDFGWKFPTVCTAPQTNKQMYIPGAKVKLLIKDLELCTKFLGSDNYITLLEAECVLLGLLGSKGI